MTSELWTKSQKQAWGYVKGGYNAGMTQTESLQMYREGGGHISTSNWGELWHRAKEGAQQWENLYQLKSSDVVPESMYTQVDINYQERYVMTFQVSIRQDTGEILHNIHRQVESSVRLTLEEWTNAARESMYEDLSSPASNVLSIEDIQFFTRS